MSGDAGDGECLQCLEIGFQHVYAMKAEFAGAVWAYQYQKQCRRDRSMA